MALLHHFASALLSHAVETKSPVPSTGSPMQLDKFPAPKCRVIPIPMPRSPAPKCRVIPIPMPRSPVPKCRVIPIPMPRSPVPECRHSYAGVSRGPVRPGPQLHHPSPTQNVHFPTKKLPAQNAFVYIKGCAYLLIQAIVKPVILTT